MRKLLLGLVCSIGMGFLAPSLYAADTTPHQTATNWHKGDWCKRHPEKCEAKRERQERRHERREHRRHEWCKRHPSECKNSKMRQEEEEMGSHR